MDKSALIAKFSGRDDWSMTRSMYLANPARLNTIEQLTYHGAQAARYAAELKAMIETMESYQQLIFDRVQALTVAPYHMEVHLTREKRYDNKVYYYLAEKQVYDVDGFAPENINVVRYAGTERHKALADFAAYQKSHPGIIAVKDIEKGKWER